MTNDVAQKSKHFQSFFCHVKSLAPSRLPCLTFEIRQKCKNFGKLFLRLTRFPFLFLLFWHDNCNASSLKKRFILRQYKTVEKVLKFLWSWREIFQMKNLGKQSWERTWTCASKDLLGSQNLHTHVWLKPYFFNLSMAWIVILNTFCTLLYK